MGLDFWKRELAKKSKKVSREVNEPANRKRKGTPTFKYPPGYTRESVDDDEGADIFLPPADSAGQKIKKEFGDGMTPAEIDEMYEDSDPPFPRRTVESSKRSKLNGDSDPPFPRRTDEPSKRSKLNGAGRFSTRPVTPVKKEGLSCTDTPVE